MKQGIIISILVTLLALSIGFIIGDNLEFNKEITGKITQDIPSSNLSTNTQANEEKANNTSQETTQENKTQTESPKETTEKQEYSGIQAVQSAPEEKKEDIYSKKYETFSLSNLEMIPTSQAVAAYDTEYDNVKSMLEPGLTVWVYYDKRYLGNKELCDFLNSAEIKYVVILGTNNIGSVRCPGISTMVKIGPSNRTNTSP